MSSETVKVRILTETHEHEGKTVKVGTVLDVAPATAVHLVSVHAAEMASGLTATTAMKATGGAE